MLQEWQFLNKTKQKYYTYGEQKIKRYEKCIDYELS